MNLNKVILIGRLTQDPEARTTPSGQNVTTIKMATNRVWTDQATGRKEATEFHTVIAWGRLGDIASNYLKKGALVMIEGRLQTRSWVGTKDSVKHYTTEIIAENLQMGPRASGTGSGSYEPSAGGFKRPAPSQSPSPSKSSADPEIPVIDENEPMNAGVEEDEMAIKESDLPF
jgi:single-strand DNA-binding protein